MRWLDLPPVWLLAAILLARAIGRLDPLGLSFGGAWAMFAAGLLIGAGLIVIMLALIELRRHGTPVMPRRDPSSLVTTGIFRRSRNPVYLGDVLILAGFILRLDAPLALPLLPLFVWLIERRFILPEEEVLRRRFRHDWGRYERDTRRWF